jgi:DNA-binding winged helix-turn-helix (wHTH) protein/predicted ATPase
MGTDCRFGPFVLDLRNERLWRGPDELVLRPKTFAVLSHLVQHAGDLVSRDALLEAVWPGIAVTEAVLTVCIGEIRQALGDDPRAAQYVETVHRRGYRFIPAVASMPPSSPSRPPASSPHPASLVGRDAELRQLDRCLEQAQRGSRSVAFVSGEAGIGKTTLVETFLDRVAVGGDIWCARGQCIAHYGSGEAYLPILDALSRMGRQLGDGALTECLRRYAPTWLGQMPALSAPADGREAPPRPGPGTGRDRMLRELTEALEALTAARPVILVLEDLQWSDYATLDLVSWLAERQEPARLLLLGTFRPVEVIVRDHPLQAVKQELTRHGRCVELPLELLSAAEVGRYLAARFGDHGPWPELARTIHGRTDGHPLFLVTLVDALVRGGWLVEHGGQWQARPGIAAAAQEIPKSVQELVEQQFQQLSAEDQRLLEAASVVGLEGSATAIAAALADDVVAIEERCTALARRGQFLLAGGVEEWADGTVAGRYRFRHTLHRQVVYDRLAIGRRVQLHARIGTRQEAGYGPQAAEHAAELATHFEQGRAYGRALRYRQQAASNAARRHAYQEAIDHLRGGLALLPRLPEDADRTRLDLELHLALGHALSAVHGPAASAVGDAYTRARALCGQVGHAPTDLAVFQGLRRFYLGRAQVERARELGEDILRVAQRLGDSALQKKSHAALGTCLLYLGELTAARSHLTQGLADEHEAALSGATVADLDADSVCRTSMGSVLWLLGYPDQALVQVEKALALSRAGGPLIEVSVLSHVAVVHQFRRDAARVREHAEAAMRLATDGGFSLWEAHASMLHGWALAMQGQSRIGIEQITRGLAVWHVNDQRLGQPYMLSLLAEAHGLAGQPEAGLEAVAEGLAAVEAHGLRMYESALLRVRGQLLGLMPKAHHREADACFERAIDIARAQGARSLELLAALGLARAWARRGRQEAARRRLAPIYDGFTEGFDTGDLRDARALLGR